MQIIGELSISLLLLLELMLLLLSLVLLVCLASQDRMLEAALKEISQTKSAAPRKHLAKEREAPPWNVAHSMV